jgi:hypothetical protein
VIVTGSVSVLAVEGTIINGVHDRRARAAEAPTARSQDLLERTYLELLGYAHRRREQAEAIRPLVTEKGQPQPIPITQEKIARGSVARLGHRQRRGAQDPGRVRCCAAKDSERRSGDHRD